MDAHAFLKWQIQSALAWIAINPFRGTSHEAQFRAYALYQIEALQAQLPR